MKRRYLSLALAAVCTQYLTGCGGSRSDGATSTAGAASTPAAAPAAVAVKLSFNAARNTSTAWTDDNSLILTGTGNFTSPGFKFDRGRLTSGVSSVDMVVQSATTFLFTSADGTETAQVDLSDPAMKVVRSFKDNKFVGGVGFFDRGGQAFMGSFTTDNKITPSQDSLSNARAVDFKLAERSRVRPQSLLALVITSAIPSAFAQTDPVAELGKDIIKTALSAVPFLAGGLGAFFCGPGLALAALCGIGAFGITSLFFRPLLAQADELPPRLFLRSLPPAGTIPFGQVVYVDDGGCPAGQIKRVVGGDNSRGIPRVIDCISIAAVP